VNASNTVPSEARERERERKRGTNWLERAPANEVSPRGDSSGAWTSLARESARGM
jgi:hypothetical protein